MEGYRSVGQDLDPALTGRKTKDTVAATTTVLSSACPYSDQCLFVSLSSHLSPCLLLRFTLSVFMEQSPCRSSTIPRNLLISLFLRPTGIVGIDKGVKCPYQRISTSNVCIGCFVQHMSRNNGRCRSSTAMLPACLLETLSDSHPTSCRLQPHFSHYPSPHPRRKLLIWYQ